MKTKILVFGFLLVSAISCTYTGPVYTGQPVVSNSIDNISIIPFKYTSRADRAVIPDQFLSDFNSELYKRLSAGLVGVKVTKPVISDKALQSMKTSPESIDFIPEFCRKTGCDAVLTGEIKEYGERVGGEYGVEDPASFAFITKLHEGKSGNIIWEDYYYEKQKMLTENLIEVDKFIKRKGRFVSVQEIAYEGIDQLVIKLNGILK